MNYTIKDYPKPNSTKVYHTRPKDNSVVYKINNVTAPDDTNNDKPVIFKEGDAYGRKLFIKLEYTSIDNVKSQRYITLQDYILCGTIITENDIVPIESKYTSLAAKFKAQQEREMYERMSNGMNPKDAWDTLPNFFRWNGTDLKEHCDSYLTKVEPKIYIDNPVDVNGNLTTEAMENIEKYAEEVAQKAVDNYLSGLDLGYKISIDVPELTAKRV